MYALPPSTTMSSAPRGRSLRSAGRAVASRAASFKTGTTIDSLGTAMCVLDHNGRLLGTDSAGWIDVSPAIEARYARAGAPGAYAVHFHRQVDRFPAEVQAMAYAWLEARLAPEGRVRSLR